MSDLNLKQRLDQALCTVKKAGEQTLLARGHLQVNQKLDNDFVTQVDRDTETYIRKSLLSAFPEDGFLGEEYGVSGDRGSLWVLDPIDGTTNYIRGLEEYAISLAYLVQGHPVLGIVFCPAMDSLYTALEGEGAFHNGQPIHVCAEERLRETIVGMSFAHRNPEASAKMHRLIAELMAHAGDMRRSGSAALDLCRVADGSYGVFVEPYLNIYDIAAGIVIVQQAGGSISGFSPQEDPLVTGNILATNKKLHIQMESILSRVFHE